MRNSLVNSCFKDVDDIVDACCDAWHVFSANIDQVNNYAIESGLLLEVFISNSITRGFVNIIL